MRIVINARFLTQKITGVQRFAIEIAKEIKRILPQATFVAPRNIIDMELANSLGAIVIGKRKGVLWEQYDLPLYLRKNGRPLLLNLCNAAPLNYSNQVVTIHDIAFIINPSWFSKKFVWFYKILIPRIAKTSKLIFTVSDFSKREIVKYLNIKEEKIKVVYNSTSYLPISVKAGNQYGRYILAVGSIEKRKNIAILIEAFDTIKDKDIKLLIAGDVSSIFNNKNIDNLKNNKQVNFLGRVNDDELSYLYTNALIFMYPSLYEGFGIPPLEAMLYNCPTIVSDIESLHEVCGDASLYIDPNNPMDITQKIDLLSSDQLLKNKLIEKGKQNIKKYSWKKSATIVADTITNLN